MKIFNLLNRKCFVKNRFDDQGYEGIIVNVIPASWFWRNYNSYTIEKEDWFLQDVIESRIQLL
jgi:hypothetical protein